MPVAEVKKSGAQKGVSTPPAEPAQNPRSDISGGLFPSRDYIEVRRSIQPEATAPHRPDIHASGPDFTNHPTSRPNPSNPQDLKRYSLGVEAQTVPLDAIGKDGKTTPQRFFGIQKDTLAGTMYYLSPADYRMVHKAYHPDSKAASIDNEVNNDSFSIKGRQIVIVRLPDRDVGTPALQRDGSVKLSRDEKRYLDALSLRQHQLALGHGDYKAYYDFYRRNDPNQRRTNDANQPPALTAQDIHDKLTQHALELYLSGSLNDKDLVQIFTDLRAATSEETLLRSLVNADPSGHNSQLIESILVHIENESIIVDPLASVSSVKELYKAEPRQRKALAHDRIALAQTLNIQNDSIETQRTRLAPLLKRESVMQELVQQSPIELRPGTTFTSDHNHRSYVQVAAREMNRPFTLTDGTTIIDRNLTASVLAEVALGDPSEDVRTHALQWLAHTSLSEAASLAHELSEAGALTPDMMQRLRGASATELIKDLNPVSILSLDDQQAVARILPAIQQILCGTDSVYRVNAVGLLAQERPLYAIPMLTLGAQVSDAVVREAALTALGAIDSETANSVREAQPSLVNRCVVDQANEEL